MRLLAEGSNLSRNVMLLFILVGLAIAVSIEVDHWKRGPLIRELNFFLYDKYIKNINNTQVSENVVIVDIDEKSLQSIGQWPWPRYKLGHLIQAADDLGASAIGLDILMPEPDRAALESIRRGIKEDFGIDISITGLPQNLLDNDKYLQEILKTTPTVSSHYFLFDHTTSNKECSLKKIEVEAKVEGLNLFEAPGLLCNTDKLQHSNTLSGFINTLDDEDGILRKLPMLIKYENQYYPNLALATVMQGLKLKSIQLERDRHGIIASLGKHHIPIEQDGTMLLRYPGPARMYKYIPAIDLLEGRVREKEIKNKIIFIGSSAAGLYDFHHTIYDPNYPGVETLAVAAGNIIENLYVREPSWGKICSFIFSLLTVLIMSSIFIYAKKPGQAVFVILLYMSAVLAVSVVFFGTQRLFIPVSAPLLSCFLLFTIFSVIRYGIEQRQNYLWYQRMVRSQQVTLESMATLVETRDYETGGHIKRTQHFVRILAEELVKMGLHDSILTPGYIHLLYISAPLHDIGKVGVPDNILFKPGPLTVAEFEQMKKHTEYGRNILINSGKRLGGDNFLELAREIAESHHEKWDGTGYPLGLAGEEIPISGRIMMVADVYDALTSKRCYKPAFSHKQAREILLEGKGSFFDPKVIEAFFNREDDIIRISTRIRGSYIEYESFPGVAGP